MKRIAVFAGVGLLLLICSCGSDTSGDAGLLEDEAEVPPNNSLDITTTTKTTAGTSTGDGTPPPEEDSSCENACSDSETCVAGRCTASCYNDSCASDQACRSREGLECVSPWECDPELVRAVFTTGVCTLEWTCQRGVFELLCESVEREGLEGEGVECVCMLEGKEQSRFEWSQALCDADKANYLAVINGQCGWAIGHRF